MSLALFFLSPSLYLFPLDFLSPLFELFHVGSLLQPPLRVREGGRAQQYGPAHRFCPPIHMYTQTHTMDPTLSWNCPVLYASVVLAYRNCPFVQTLMAGRAGEKAKEMAEPILSKKLTSQRFVVAAIVFPSSFVQILLM